MPDTLLGAKNPFEIKTKIFALMELYILDGNCLINSATFNKSTYIFIWKIQNNRKYDLLSVHQEIS